MCSHPTGIRIILILIYNNRRSNGQLRLPPLNLAFFDQSPCVTRLGMMLVLAVFP